MREPGNDLQCVELFLFGVLAIGGHAVTGAKTADIDTGAHVAAAGKIGVQRVVARGGPIMR